ncbi:lachrymatory-factor synthase-like [Phoenix dactylifera]|uniref:Lachrymatory-factor synthase-like n=1 Tax=Phoenix dactylifera TaxID=42345 RepID=A0A8B7CAL0_PHODC|nr:lachrymatory-factor synthase-like [Phoenix dactylifera]
MEQNQLEKWEGKASIDLPNAKADQAWSLLSNFFSLHLWLPAIAVCEKVAGIEGQPGCTRYCATAPGDDREPVMWAKEKLLAFDPVARSYCYEVTDSNVGFDRYVATFKVLEVEGGGGCKLEWSFESEPVKGWTRDGLTAYLQTGLEDMAKKVEEVLKAPPAFAAAG